MTDIDTSVYERRRRNVDDQYGATTATNAYSRFLSQKRGDRQVGDFQQGFKRSFPSFTAGFGQRGMTGGGVQSGVFQKALRDYSSDYSRDLNRLHEDNADSMRNFDLQQSQLDQWRTGALLDIETDKNREIANAAQALRALQPYMSGG